jgi:hypothetical protein
MESTISDTRQIYIIIFISSQTFSLLFLKHKCAQTLGGQFNNIFLIAMIYIRMNGCIKEYNRFVNPYTPFRRRIANSDKLYI